MTICTCPLGRLCLNQGITSCTCSMQFCVANCTLSVGERLKWESLQGLIPDVHLSDQESVQEVDPKLQFECPVAEALEVEPEAETLETEILEINTQDAEAPDRVSRMYWGSTNKLPPPF